MRKLTFKNVRHRFDIMEERRVFAEIHYGDFTDTTKEEAEKCAALIVKAVNNHDSLLAALKYLFEQSLKRDDAPDNEMDIAWAEATMAIKAAEEE